MAARGLYIACSIAPKRVCGDDEASLFVPLIVLVVEEEEEVSCML